jgi:hypothetical protein
MSMERAESSRIRGDPVMSIDRAAGRQRVGQLDRLAIALRTFIGEPELTTLRVRLRRVERGD